MELERSGGIYCSQCKSCISPPRKRKHYRARSEMLCLNCHEDKFSDEQFSLIHLGKDKWIIKNMENQSWCGKDMWVHINSSHFQLCGDCKETVFSYKELIEFVSNHFETSLKD